MGELTAHLVQWVLGLITLGIAAGYGQRWALEVSGRWIAFFAVLLPAVVVAATIVILPLATGPLNLIGVSIPLATSRDWIAIFLITCSLAAWLTAITALGIGFWDRLFAQGILDAMRGGTRLFPPVLIFGALAVTLASFADTLDPDHRFFWVDESTITPHLLIVAVLAMIGFNASGGARAIACRGLERLLTLLITVIPTLLFAVATFALLRITFDTAETSGDLAFIVRTLEITQTPGPFQRLGIWMGVHLFIVFSLALGGAIGLRYGPKPWAKVKPLTPWHWSQFRLIQRISGKRPPQPIRARVKVRLDDYATSGGALPAEEVEAARAAALIEHQAKQKAQEQARQQSKDSTPQSDTQSAPSTAKSSRQRVKVRFEELAKTIETVRDIASINLHTDRDADLDDNANSTDQQADASSPQSPAHDEPPKGERVKIRTSDWTIQPAPRSDKKEKSPPAQPPPDEANHSPKSRDKKRTKVRFSELARDYINAGAPTAPVEHESDDASSSDFSSPSNPSATTATTIPSVTAGHALAAPPIRILFLGASLFAFFILWQLLYPFDFQHNPRPRWLIDESMPTLSTLANVALFVPLGILLAWAMRLRIRSWLAIAALTILAGALLSVIGETIQMWLPKRFSSIMDLAANTLGSFLGVLVVAFTFTKLNTHWHRASIWLDPRPKSYRALWWIAGLALVRFYPMDLSPDTFYTKRQTYYESRALLQPFTRVLNYLRARAAGGANDPDSVLRTAAIHEAIGVTTTFLVFLPVSFLIAAAMRESHRLVAKHPGPALRALTLGLTLVIATEAFQWIVKSRVLDTSEPLAGFVAVVLGVLGESLWDRVRQLDPKPIRATR